MDLRDNVDLGYSMIYWNGGNGGSVAQQAIPTGVLPLVITEAGGRINGTSTNDQMYGSSGTIHFILILVMILLMVVVGIMV